MASSKDQRTLPFANEAVFGQHFAKRNTRPILQIGDVAYTRYDLGLIGCPHIASAITLDRILRQFHIKNVKQIATELSPEDFVGVKGVGVTTFYALTCVLEDAGIPLSKFYASKVTVNTMQKNVRRDRGKRKRRRAA